MDRTVEIGDYVYRKDSPKMIGKVNHKMVHPGYEMYEVEWEPYGDRSYPSIEQMSKEKLGHFAERPRERKHQEIGLGRVFI